MPENPLWLAAFSPKCQQSKVEDYKVAWHLGEIKRGRK
jgi:hypothetical protein